MNKELENKYIINTDFDSLIDLMSTNENLTSPKVVMNIDTYLDENDILKDHKITLRRRKSKDDIKFTVKKEVLKSNSTLDRIEEEFDTLYEALEFIEKSFNISLNVIDKVMTLSSKRIKYKILFDGSIIELSFDKCTLVKDNNNVVLDILELELISGKNSLDTLNEIILNKYGSFLTPTYKNKKEIMEELLRKENFGRNYVIF